MLKFYKVVFRIVGRMYILVYWMFVLYLYLLQMSPLSESFSDDFSGFLLIAFGWLCTIVVFAVGHYLIKKRQAREQKKLSGTWTVKKQNPDLTAWKKGIAFWKDGRVLWCAAFVIFYMTTGKLYLCLALLPYLLFRALVMYATTDFSARLFMENLTDYRYTATSHDEENNNYWKEITHAVLMKDDTKRVPVTFSALRGQPTDILVFDNATEILPHPKDVTEARWAEIYLHAAFLVYVLDAEKYTPEQLRMECEQAVLYTHFQVSKPVYIFLIGDGSKLQYVKDAYDWMPEVHFQIVRDYRKVDLQYAIDDYHSRKWVSYGKMPKRATGSKEEELLYTELLAIEETRDNRAIRKMIDYRPETIWYHRLFEKLFKQVPKKFTCHDERFFLRAFTNYRLEDLPALDKNVFYRNYNKYSSHIYLTIPHQDEMYCFVPQNYYLCGFFQNVFRENERIPSILAGFDYAELLLRFVLYHMAVKSGLGFDETLVDDNLQFMGDKILELATPEDVIYPYITTSVDVTVTLHNALAILMEYFPIRTEGDKLSFGGLCMLLRVVRNQTRGHGSIKEEIAEPLWFALYVLLVILGEMLRVQDFRIEIKDGEIMTGYSSAKELLPMKEYGYVSGDLPCVLYQCGKSGREYINYFRGDIIVPEIIREELSQR